MPFFALALGLLTWWLAHPGPCPPLWRRRQVRATVAVVLAEQAQAARDTAAAARADTAAWRAYNAGRAAGRAAKDFHRRAQARTLPRAAADTAVARRLQHYLANY
ncbi:MAG: hypothetical protein ACRYG7_46225 [Janthinobacterium lividum]